MVEIPKITEPLIDDRRRRFEAGDKAALLDAVDLCARAGLPMPGWLAEAYCAASPHWAAYRAALTRRGDWRRPQRPETG